jgi:CDP-glucose 4,6-dehydratase
MSADTCFTWEEVAAFYRDKRVLVTGHTGFKGSWLCEWLLSMGAYVTGFSLDVPTQPALFDELALEDALVDVRGDVRNIEVLRQAVQDAAPDLIFHLAAQSLVREGYQKPVETFSTNVMGTVNLLDILREQARPCTVVLVSSDKCYENLEWQHAYRESDAMGGHDPYSASKGCMEIAVAAYRRSFFSAQSAIRVASARAGNVIGGGDWAMDRIVPDCIRHLDRSEPILVRNAHAVRPWQHVLEPLSGYLLLGYRLASTGGTSSSDWGTLASSFNFGPFPDSTCTVAALVEHVLKVWPGEWLDGTDPDAPHEAGFLMLAVDKAVHTLGWRPRWSVAEAVQFTVEWYQQALTGPDRSASMMRNLTRDQIERYCSTTTQGVQSV